MYRMRDLRLDAKSAWTGAATLLALALIANVRMLMDAGVPISEYLPRLAIQGLSVWALVPFIFVIPSWLDRRQSGEAFRIAVVYCASAIGSAVNYLIADLLTHAFGLTPLTMLGSQLVSIFVVGPVWIVMLGKVLEAWLRYRAAQHALVGEALRAEYVRMHETGTIELLHAKVSDWVVGNLSDKGNTMLERLRQLDSGEPDSIMQKFAEDLRGTAQGEVRSVSRELWADASRATIPRPPAGFIWTIVSTQKFAPRLVALVYFAGLLSDAAGSPRFTQEMGSAAIEAGFVWAFLGIANVLMTRLPRQHVRVYIGVWAFIQISNVVSLATLHLEFQPYVVAIHAVFDSVLSSALLLGTSSIWLVQDLMNNQLRQMRQTMDAEWVNRVATMQQLTGISREFATHLHGQVQAGMLAGATALEQAVASRDPIAAQTAMSQVQDLLEQLTILPSHRPKPLPELIRTTCEKWSAVCDIELDLDSRLAGSDSAGGQMAAKVIEEAITNSFRHGQAERIWVRVRANEAGNLEVEVSDDGRGFSRPRAGLGHSFIEFASNGDWSLTRVHDRTVLNASVPVGRLDLSAV